MNNTESIGELRDEIRSVFASKIQSSWKRFQRAELNPIMESLSMRETSDIASLLPHVMIAVLDQIECGGDVDSIEYVYYLLDGFDENSLLRESKRALFSSFEEREVSCVCRWLKELKKRRAGPIASDDLDSCIKYWCAC
jgi:hypothetical protein